MPENFFIHLFDFTQWLKIMVCTKETQTKAKTFELWACTTLEQKSHLTQTRVFCRKYGKMLYNGRNILLDFFYKNLSGLIYIINTVVHISKALTTRIG